MSWNKALIEIRLKSIKSAVGAGRLIFVPRKKNNDALARLGLTIVEVQDLICKLTIAEYERGPLDDNDKSDGSIWIFLRTEFGEVIYIKLKLFVIEDLEYVKILSFHGEAENE